MQVAHSTASIVYFPTSNFVKWDQRYEESSTPIIKKISKNKNSEIIINEKFLTIHNQNKISGYNEYLIKITKSKILFFFNTGPNCGKLFQKFENFRKFILHLWNLRVSH